MQWIAPSEKDNLNGTLEKRLWEAADQFRADSGLNAQEYSATVLGLILLRFAEVRFSAQRKKLEKSATSSRRGSRLDDPTAYHAEGILYLAAEARFDFLLHLPKAENGGAKFNAAMRHREAQSTARWCSAKNRQPFHQHPAQGTATRDLLLPRLLLGQVNLKEN
jgi:type I restriction enzyme M protein